MTAIKNTFSEFQKIVWPVFFAAFFYVMSEWLFFITKPSTLSEMSGYRAVSSLLLNLLLLFVAALVVQLLLFVAGRAIFFAERLRPTVPFLALTVPAFLMAAALFLLLENFTYTLFGFASFYYDGVGRFVYLQLFLSLFILCLFWAVDVNRQQSEKRQRLAGLAAIGLLLVSVVFLYGSQNRLPAMAAVDAGEGLEPGINVLFLFADGIDASHMSLYGYPRATTPFLDSIRDELLIFRNHFTNSAKTTASVGSLLSGKYPTTTRVIFRPDVFSGIHVYEHLPGILKRYGYSNADFSVRHYVDPVDLNMREGFDWANGRDVSEKLSWLRRSYPDEMLFAAQIFDRIDGRLQHILNLDTMTNPYAVVAAPSSYAYKLMDRTRINNLKAFMGNTEGPFFAHVHLLGSHGPQFFAEKSHFAEGPQTIDWSADHYDDAVLQYDRYVEEVVNFLKSEDLYANTLLVLNSDHGHRWGVETPIPLVLRFPQHEYTGVREYPTQRLDIPFSLLEYLGINAPGWMEGNSLFSEVRESVPPIYVVDRAPSMNVRGWRQVALPKAPFYTLGKISAIYCDKIYHLDLLRPTELKVEAVQDYFGDCTASDYPSQETVYKGMVKHLQERGYETSSLIHP